MAVARYAPFEHKVNLFFSPYQRAGEIQRQLLEEILNLHGGTPRQVAFKFFASFYHTNNFAIPKTSIRKV